MRLLAPPRAPSDLWDLWRACDRRTTTATHRRRAQLDLKSGRRAGKDADRRRLDQVDEPDAQCAPQGRYLRGGHQRDERAHEGESVRANRTAQQWRNKCASIPLTAQIARPARPTQLTTAGTPQDDRIPTPQPRPSDPAPRRSLALAGVPAPKHALSARDLARSIDLDRCTGATQKSAAVQRRRGPVEALRAAPPGFERPHARDIEKP